MLRVERPQGRPGWCAVISGKTEDPEGFIKTGQIIAGWDPEVEISATAVREMGRLLGFPTPEEYRDLEVALNEAQRDLEDVRAQLAEADRELNAVEILKNNRAWSEAKRPGRPRKED